MIEKNRKLSDKKPERKLRGRKLIEGIVNVVSKIQMHSVKSAVLK